MNWKEQIPGCFGNADLIWGSHDLERQRARQMLKDAIDAGATMDDIVHEVEVFQIFKRATNGHIEDQVGKVRNLSF
jgi:hypothetical protein